MIGLLRRVLCKMGFHSHYVMRLPSIPDASVVYCWRCCFAKRYPTQQCIQGYQPLSSRGTSNSPPRKP